MRAIAKNRDIIIGNRTINVDSLFSNETIGKSNSSADCYYEDICVINELYEEYILPSFDIESFIAQHGITELDLHESSLELLSVYSFLCRKNSIKAVSKPSKYKLWFKIMLNNWGSFLYILYSQIKQTLKPVNKQFNSVVFLRSKSTKQKFSKIKEIDRFTEDEPGFGSLYEQVRKVERIRLLLKAARLTTKTRKDIKNYLKQHDMKECIPYALYHYSKRLIHTMYYYLVQDNILAKNRWATLYTGNNLDRFALNEEKLAAKHNMKLICIPHGIEYGYKFPKCFVGDIFYTTSEKAAECLNELYSTDKFQFSSEIGSLMFKIDSVLFNEKKVVYFSEPREFNVNITIIEKLYSILNPRGVQVYIKLHPIDIKENYKEIIELGIREITDYTEAIFKNICVARKSTVLIEAIYNGSEAIAILTNEKDYHMFHSFPSFLDVSIKSFNSIEKAGNYILSKINVTYKQNKVYASNSFD